MNSDSKTELFENYPVHKALLTMAVPTIISQLINLIYNLVDAFFIGRTGNPYMIAGVSICLPVFMFTSAIANMFGIGGGSLVSRLIGIREHDRAKSVSAFSFYGGIIAALVYSLILVLFRDNVLNLLGASGNTTPYAGQYVLIVLVMGSLFIISSQIMAHLLRNVGYSKQASIGLSMGGIINIVLDPLFMFVWLPDGYEVVGAALATLISNCVSFTYLVITVYKVSKKASLSIKVSNVSKIAKVDRNKIFSVGIPSGSLNALYDLACLSINSLMATHGDLAVAAIGIVMKVERLPNAVNIGLCQGMLPIVAYNYSNGNTKRMKETLNTARIWGLLFCIFTTAMYEIFSPQLTGIFLNTSSGSKTILETAAFATVFLRIRSVGTALQFFNYHPSFSLQAMGNGKGTMAHSMIRQLVFHIPSMFILNYFFGIYGLVASIIVGEGLGAVIAHVILHSTIKKAERRPA